MALMVASLFAATSCYVEDNYVVKIDHFWIHAGGDYITELTMEKGESVQLTTEVWPTMTTQLKFYWSSSDESVATVSADGVLTAVGYGECIITAESAENPDVTYSFPLYVPGEGIAIDDEAVDQSEADARQH